MKRFGRRYWVIGFAAVAMVIAVGIGRALAFPEPTIVPSSWQLDIRYDHPSAIAVRLPGESDVTTWWYFTYTVTNNSSADQNFVPEITMFTDAGDLIRANRNIPPRVFQTIKEALRNPLLKSPTEVAGRILLGEDNALDGIAIWPMPAHDVNNVHIFIQGLSGETYPVTDPLTGETHLMRRTLVTEYETPGSIEKQPRKPWLFKSEKWVVR